MARALRIEYAGPLYHVMARGNKGHEIFREDADRRCWLKTLGEACQKTAWRVHAYVRRRNHYHLVLETPGGQPGAGDEMAARNLHLALRWDALPKLDTSAQDHKSKTDFVLAGMLRAQKEAGCDVNRFLALFERYVKQPIRDNPEMLRKSGWKTP